MANVRFHEVEEFIAEIRKDAADVERKILRLVFRTKLDNAMHMRSMALVASAVIGGHVVTHFELIEIDIRPGDDRPRLSAGPGEGDGALVAIDREVVGGDAVASGRRPRAGLVTGRTFDLDHGGAQVGEQHRAVRPGEHAREIGDDQAVERPAGVGHVRLLRRSSTGR